MGDFGREIAVLYSHVRRADFKSEQAFVTEKDAESDANSVVFSLKNAGYNAFSLPADEYFLEKLKAKKPQFVFNLVGSVRGKDYLASTIPAMLEFLDVPYSGANVFCESLGYNKFLVAEILDSYKIKVPKSQLFVYEDEAVDGEFKYPLISKLNEIHGGVEMNEDAISYDEKHLRNRIIKLMKIYGQSVLVQEFICGREFTAMVLEGGDKEVFLAEKSFRDTKEGMSFATFEAQWLDTDEDAYEYKKYEDPLLEETVKTAFKVLQMSDYGKFDVRQNERGEYFIIDANSNPAFAPKDCAISTVLGMYGISFEEILRRIIEKNLR